MEGMDVYGQRANLGHGSLPYRIMSTVRYLFLYTSDEGENLSETR